MTKKGLSIKTQVSGNGPSFILFRNYNKTADTLARMFVYLCRLLIYISIYLEFPLFVLICTECIFSEVELLTTETFNFM
jgi:hypothetical protein